MQDASVNALALLRPRRSLPGQRICATGSHIRRTAHTQGYSERLAANAGFEGLGPVYRANAAGAEPAGPRRRQPPRSLDKLGSLVRAQYRPPSKIVAERQVRQTCTRARERAIAASASESHQTFDERRRTMARKKARCRPPGARGKRSPLGLLGRPAARGADRVQQPRGRPTKRLVPNGRRTEARWRMRQPLGPPTSEQLFTDYQEHADVFYRLNHLSCGSPNRATRAS